MFHRIKNKIYLLFIQKVFNFEQTYIVLYLYLIIFGCYNLDSIAISLIVVLGTPSSSQLSSFIFFKATNFALLLSNAFVTIPYVPSPNLVY